MSWTITGTQKTSVDPLFGSVSILLHGNLVTTSTNIVDSSPAPNTVTASGTAVISTAQNKFGEASIASGTSGQAQWPSSSAFNFTGVDFTIEFWYYLNALPSEGAIFATRASGAATIGLVFYQASSTLYLYAGSPAGGFDIANGPVFGTVSTGQWYHIALTRSANTYRLFFNGTLANTFTSSLILGFPSNALSISGQADGGQKFNGYVDEFRITKGVARYQAAFTPQSAPFPDI